MNAPEDDPLLGQRVMAADLRDAWAVLDPEARVEGFRYLTSAEAEEFFLELNAHDRALIVLALPSVEQRWWLRALPPDDVADLIQAVPEEQRSMLLGLLDDATRREITVLLAYSEDEAGGLMNPRYARLRSSMSVDEAIGYLRRQTRERVENIYYAYVLDEQQKLVGVVSFRQLMMARGDARVREVMVTELITVQDEMDQEAVARIFAQHNLMCIPVLDPEGRMKGIVTADDIVDVVREEATEDIQKIGGSEALDAPYLQVGLWEMLKKRAGWLMVLFVGGTFTVSAIGHFQGQIAKVGYLETFIAMIISCGGNSGSQASTLVIRAMALGEVRLRDWWRVFLRECAAGLCLGGILGSLGLLRIVAWHHLFEDQAGQAMYGDEYLRIGITVALAVIGVATWGTLVGALLPFGLRRLGLDPASASAPLVATLSDVTGIMIFFSIAIAVLSGSVL